MSRVLRFTQLDLRVQQATLKTTLAVGALLALLTWVTAPLPPLIVAVFTFRADERGRLDALYAVLPVRRAQVVGGRYLTMLGIQLLFAAIGVLLAFAAAAVKGVPMDASLAGLILSAGFALNALILAVETPVLFRVGYARARWVMFTPVLVIAALGALANLSGVNLTQFALSLRAAAWAPALLPVGGLAVLALSALASTRLYAGRDL